MPILQRLLLLLRLCEDPAEVEGRAMICDHLSDALMPCWEQCVPLFVRYAA